MTGVWTSLAMRLAHPEWVGAIALALVATAAAVIFARLRAARRMRALLAGATARSAFPLASDLALLAAALCIGVALLGPRLGERVVREPASGIDLVLLLDVSRSMDAQDVPPSRLDRARRTARQVLERLAPGDRAALAAFAGHGVLLTPLTPDTAALAELLPALDSELMGSGGSRVAAGVEAAIEAFEAGSERPRVLLLLADGEDPEARTEVGALRALRAGVRVVAVTFGSEIGATIPDHGVPLRDTRGAVVVTRRGGERPARLTSETGGVLLEADAWGAVDPDALVATLRRDAGAAPGEAVERRAAAVRVWPFAALAFLLLLVETRPTFALRGSRRGARPAPLRATATAACALLLLAPTGPRAADPDVSAAREAAVGARAGDARALLQLGVSRMERGRPKAASRAFLAAALTASDSELAAVGYYGLGVAALERGDLESARDAFFDALALAPRDRQARFNLEWTLLALEAEPPPPPPAQPEPREGEGEDTAQERPESAPRPEPGETTPPPDPAPQPSLSQAERRRLLDQVQDDPSRAFREAARRAAGDDARRRRPAARW